MDMRSQFYRDISFNVFFLLYTNWYRSFFITCFLSFKVMLSLQVLSWANNTILSSELPKLISCSLSKLNHWADDKLLQFLCKEYSCAICSFLNQNPGLRNGYHTQTPSFIPNLKLIYNAILTFSFEKV